ncbi:hypothetical protein XF_2319 [Xylella fastidiosa 9a5c]|uniref:Uncharacterized protein n=1 Tax=Xylella fastidiosa (strain 9a5c) TaxID=160492 RepID=Q9PB26_XYLFA|nr:hypothetical protein XF_2319 [Xylella fastidiosa 9a5c]
MAHCSHDRHRCGVQLQGRACALRAAANEKIQVLTMTNNTLTASLKKQNQAIADLQTEAKRREQAATATMQQARQITMQS